MASTSGVRFRRADRSVPVAAAIVVARVTDAHESDERSLDPGPLVCDSSRPVAERMSSSDARIEGPDRGRGARRPRISHGAAPLLTSNGAGPAETFRSNQPYPAPQGDWSDSLCPFRAERSHQPTSRLQPTPTVPARIIAFAASQTDLSV